MGSKARKKKRVNSATRQVHDKETNISEEKADNHHNRSKSQNINEGKQSFATVHQTLQRTIPVRDVLQCALNNLDHIIDEVYDANKTIFINNGDDNNNNRSINNNNNNNSEHNSFTHKRFRNDCNTNKTEEDNDNNVSTSKVNKATSIAMYEKSKVYTVMMENDLNVIEEAIVSLGIQLLPVLNSIMQRLSNLLFFTGTHPFLSNSSTYHNNSNAVQGVCLSCSKVWEVIALAAMYYSSGVNNLIEELLQTLLSSPLSAGALLLNSCLVIYPLSFINDFVCETKGNVSIEQTHTPAQECEILHQIYCKLTALEHMLASCGQMLNKQLLYSFAVQFALDVIENGILIHLERSITEDETVAIKTSSLMLSTCAFHSLKERENDDSNNNNTRSSKNYNGNVNKNMALEQEQQQQQQQQQHQVKVLYKIHAELVPPCISLLNTLLMLCDNSLPQPLHSVAIQTVKLFHEVLHRGAAIHTLFSSSPLHHKNASTLLQHATPLTSTTEMITDKCNVAIQTRVLEEINKLRLTLHLIHHPHFIPSYNGKSNYVDEITTNLNVHRRSFAIATTTNNVSNKNDKINNNFNNNDEHMQKEQNVNIVSNLEQSITNVNNKDEINNKLINSEIVNGKETVMLERTTEQTCGETLKSAFSNINDNNDNNKSQIKAENTRKVNDDEDEDGSFPDIVYDD